MDKLTKDVLVKDQNMNPKDTEKQKIINLKILKFGCFPIIILFGLISIIAVFSDKKIEQTNMKKEAIINKSEDTDEKIIEQLKREIESIDKGVDFSTYRGEIQSVQMEIVLFGAWAKNIIDAKNNKNEAINDLGEILESKVKRLQVKEFPLLRIAYKEAIYQKLWVENIETNVIGKGNRTIQFTGALFANNKNKQDTQNTLSNVLRQFRFKKVNYKWYKYDDEYTYYDMDTPNDNELVTFN